MIARDFDKKNLDSVNLPVLAEEGKAVCHCTPISSMGSRDGESHSVRSAGRNAGGSHWQRSQRSREPVDCVRCVRLRREWEHEDEE